MKCERENAEIYRHNVQGDITDDHQEANVAAVGSLVSTLRNLLDLREQISREVGSGYRAAREANSESQTSQRRRGASVDKARVDSEVRFKQSLHRGRAEEALHEQEVLQKLINAERAKLTISNARDTLRATASTSAATVLGTLDDTRQRIKREQLRRTMMVTKKDITGYTTRSVSPSYRVRPGPPRRMAPSVERTSQSRPHKAKYNQQVFAAPQQPVKPKYNQQVFAKFSAKVTKSPSIPAREMDVLRRSIESIRQSSGDIGIDDNELARPTSPIPSKSLDKFRLEREMRDASKLVERKRATLAALKLRSHNRA